MKIKELNISEFGCLKNRKIELDGGMNIIHGENESGKSTLLLFIKFMLYGLGRRSASNTERERSISWSGHVASGSMTFTHGGKNYRIERRFTDSTRGGSEAVSIICLESGESINTDKSAGEYFLGVPKEVFESSACVGQMRSSEINEEKTAASIRNMLTSADESVDTAKILKNLDSVRVGYMHKNKSGGSLYESEQKISQLRQSLDRARETNISIEENSQKLGAAQSEYETVKRDLDAKERVLGELNKISVLQRFAKLHAAEKEYLGLVEKRDELVARELKNDFIPTRAHTAELKFVAESFKSAEERLEGKKRERDNASGRIYDAELARLGEEVESNGGADAIISSVAKKRELIKRYGLTNAIMLASAIGTVVAAVALLLLGALWGLSTLAGAALFVTLFALNAKKKKELEAELCAVAEKYGASEKELAAKLKLCAENLASMRDFLALSARTEAEYSEALSTYERVKRSVGELLEKTLSAAEISYDAAKREQSRLESFIERSDALSREAQALKRVIDTDRAELAGYDEESLRAEVTTDINSVTPELIDSVQREKTFLLTKKDSLERKIMALREFLAQARANAQDPLEIADRLAQLEAENQKSREFYEALTLAIDTIQKAGEVMSGNVMPAVASKASDIMSCISGKKYTALRSTSAFSLSLDSDGFAVKADSLSAGTKDAAYLSLRIALFERIFGSELPPLILDESLCQIDDARAQRVLSTIGALTDEELQCLLFTSHNREIEICDSADIAYKKIELAGQGAQ